MYLDIHTYIYIHNKHRLIIALNNFVFKYAWLFHSTYIYIHIHTCMTNMWMEDYMCIAKAGV